MIVIIIKILHCIQILYEAGIFTDLFFTKKITKWPLNSTTLGR